MGNLAKTTKLIEPHRDTTLAAVRPREGFDYRWGIRAGGSGSSGGVEVQATATGVVTIVVLTQLHENVVVLEEVNADGQVTNRLEEAVMVKYVRREIRTLTDDEKEELLDAVSEHGKKDTKQFAYCKLFIYIRPVDPGSIQGSHRPISLIGKNIKHARTIFSVKLCINHHIVRLVHKNHIIQTCLIACKVEFQPFKRSYSQLTF